MRLARTMNDDLTPGAAGGSPNPKRALAFFAIGAVFIALGIGLFFVDGLEIVSWMLIPGGAIWIILGLSSGSSSRPSTAATRPKPAPRKDDGSAPLIIGDTGSTRSGSRADDHPAHDSFDGGGFGGGDGGGGGGGD